MNAKQVAQDLSLKEGTNRRMDCPECGGHNSFSVSLERGVRKWFCFRASCGVKGKEKAERSYDSIKSSLTLNKERSVQTYVPPDYVTSVLSDEEAMSYLHRMNSMEAYTSGKVDIRFDPKARRVMFMVYHQGKIVDAAGRALDRHQTPKWYRYANSGHPLVVGDSNVAVIVEDAPSACSVSRVTTGVSLLGTNVQHSHLSVLKGFEECYIALDKDATKKSLEIHKQLTYFVDCKVRPLEDDLKYLPEHEVREVLKI